MSVLDEERLVFRDGLAFADEDEPASPYALRWEEEAIADPLRSAIASTQRSGDELPTLTAKLTPLWDRFPQDRRVGALLDVGVGYGRIELFLSMQRGLRCTTFCAVDISETMLRRMLEYRRRYDVFPGAQVLAVRASADRLPLADACVDLALSSTAFLHMGKSHAERALAELARVLKPGGDFILDFAFPNARNPANFVPRLKPAGLRKPNALKYWTRAEIDRAIRGSGLADRVAGFRIEAARYQLLPKELGPLPVPFARRVNAALGRPRRLQSVLAVAYSAYSDGALP